MDVIFEIEEQWRGLLARGRVPIITSQDDIVTEGGDTTFRWKTFPLEDGNWELDFIPSRNNSYLAPEVKHATEIPCSMHPNAFLYGLGVWLRVDAGVRNIDEMFPSSLFYLVRRCMLDKPPDRSFVYA
jgi:hypothetical protein